ncbi:MAG: hypothetical protein IPK94_08220 [Saprospiraceae bacterium]|nr:hypothetical protein [Saprospiraceae bacterium]
MGTYLVESPNSLLGMFRRRRWLVDAALLATLEYTKDSKLLKERAFPAIQEVTRFYSDWIIEDPRDGTLISAPSTSPENRFFNDEGKAVATCLGSAMDQQIIYEVFDNYLKACAILEVNNDFVEKVKQQKINYARDL